MITSFEVGAVFGIKDEATATQREMSGVGGQAEVACSTPK